MSTSAAGRLVDDGGTAWAGFTVVARDTSGIFDVDLASTVTGVDGRFTLPYEADVLGARTIEFEVLDKVSRRVARMEREDVSDASLDLGDVVIRRSDATGYLVTLGTGVAKRVSAGNAVRLMVDNAQTWKLLSDLFGKAQHSIELMQLFFEVPSRFKFEAHKEKPVMVVAFDEDRPLPRKVDAGDARPERLLYKAADRGAEVRILLNRFQVEGHFVGAALLLPGLGLLAIIGGFLFFELGGSTSVNEVDAYFDEANKGENGDGGTIPTLKVFEARAPVFGPTHAKLVIVDGADSVKATAVIIGSPFEQAYFGGHPHAIDDPRRGHGTRTPIHDVNMAVRGPAVADLHAAFKLHWDIASSPDPGEAPSPIPAIEPPRSHELGGDPIADLQMVRTLDTGRFPDPDEGEQGILEAYLRAIGIARRLIYLENQFFTNEAIATALTRALKDPSRPDLQVIMLLNIRPDSVLYARWQRKLIARMRDDLTDLERARFGVFTRWTHEAPRPPERPRPQIAETYVHSKVGIVDNEWATVGSANLDGTSLDVTHYFHGMTFGDVRASEVNCLILNGVDGQRETFAVDLLRRELWARHLGFETDGFPDPQAEELTTPPAGGWLDLWDRRAHLKRDLLRSDPTKVSPSGVLPWPHEDRTLKRPREHLEAALGMKLTNLDVIEGTRAFSFAKGKFEDQRPEVDD